MASRPHETAIYQFVVYSGHKYITMGADDKIKGRAEQ
jgi:hypothetical protein